MDSLLDIDDVYGVFLFKVAEDVNFSSNAATSMKRQRVTLDILQLMARLARMKAEGTMRVMNTKKGARK